MRLTATEICKSFGQVPALKGVSFELPPGAVLAVLGENGAGKSTLMKILAGVLPPDGGILTLDGVPYAPRGPLDAQRAGVAIVHQDPELCPDLSVAENVCLGSEPTRYGLVDSRRLQERARVALSRVLPPAGRAHITGQTPVSRLEPSDRQLVALARALGQNRCRVLILDEPTSSLTSEGVTRLFDVIARLAQTQIGILYISHFLEEVERIATHYVVLRDGQSVTSGRVPGTTRDTFVRWMSGKPLAELFPRTERTLGPVVLELQALSGQQRPRDASLVLRRGEVFGIAGLVGSGRTELLRAVFGLDPIKSGQVRVKEYSGRAVPPQRWRQGLGLLSEDRSHEGLARNLSIADNLTLSKLEAVGSWGLVSAPKQRAASEELIRQLRIRCRGAGQRVGELSGGNQQKVALARLLFHDVDVFLLDEPTRGIDVTSRAEIYQRIDSLAARGKAVLLVSSQLAELLGICDRVAVMARGRLGAARPVAELTEQRLLLEAASG